MRTHTQKISWILALAVVLLAVGSVAWRLRTERAVAEAVAQTRVERATLTREIAEARQRIAAVEADESELQAALGRAGRLVAVPVASAPSKPAAPKTPPDVSLLMENDPRLRELFKRSFRANLAQRYQFFYAEARVSHEQIERLEALFTEAEQDRMDLEATARAQGMAKTSPEFAKLNKELSERHAAAQREILGDEGYKRLDQFQRVEPLIGVVNNAGVLVAHTSEPMTRERAAEIVKIMASANGAFKRGEKADPRKIKWEGVLPEAEKLLSPAQFGSLKTMSDASKLMSFLEAFHTAEKKK
jgi:hypothetical protein